MAIGTSPASVVFSEISASFVGPKSGQKISQAMGDKEFKHPFFILWFQYRKDLKSNPINCVFGLLSY